MMYICNQGIEQEEICIYFNNTEKESFKVLLIVCILSVLCGLKE